MTFCEKVQNFASESVYIFFSILEKCHFLSTLENSGEYLKYT